MSIRRPQRRDVAAPRPLRAAPQVCAVSLALAALLAASWLLPASLRADDALPAESPHGHDTLAGRFLSPNVPSPSNAPEFATLLNDGDASPQVQPIRHPLLWRVDPPIADPTVSSKPSFLFGTIHLPDPRVTTLPTVVTDAIAATDGLFTEVELDLAGQMAMARRLLLPEGQRLRDVLSEELYGRFRRYLRERGVGMRRMDRLKPWAAAMQVVQVEFVKPLGSEELLDEVVATRARGLGKQIGGIETIEEHLHAFESLTFEEQASLLEVALDSVGEFKKFEELVAAYLAGDEAMIGAMLSELMIEQGHPLSGKLFQMLVIDRNVLMARRIDEQIRGDLSKGWTYALGAAHFVGDDGVVALLRAKGYTVTRVAPTPVDASTDPAPTAADAGR